MKQKELIYFPSLSSFAPYLKKDIPLINNYSHRFYDDSFGKFAHKFFLLSAGANYKKKTMRKDLAMDDCLVFGDSGGFQIATGALKWDVSLRESIFNWLEDNSDIAMNIDIPPFGNNYSFADCLKMTVENMQWFEDHQTGKTDFLNVIQCRTIAEMEKWFAAVKGFKKFKGWGAGNVASAQNFGHLVYLFLKNRVFEDPNFKWFHFLGKTTPHHFILHAVLQKKLNQYFPHIQVTTDSSTPAMQAVFGNFYHSVNFRNQSFAKVYYGNKGKTNYIEDAKLPCGIDCPMCKELTFKNIANDGGAARFYIAYHNLFLMQKALEDINDLSLAHFDIFESILPKQEYDLLVVISELFETFFEEEGRDKTKSDENVFEKYYASKRKLLRRYQVETPKKPTDGEDNGDDKIINNIDIFSEGNRTGNSKKIITSREEELVDSLQLGKEITDFEK